MLKHTHPKQTGPIGEHSAKSSPPSAVKEVEHPAPHDDKLRGAGVISPPSTGVASINPGAISMKP
jgi:hypothetical protein